MIDVVHEMNACARSIGGEVLDEVLPAKRDFKNADYRFESAAVIAELKTIETDVANDDTFKDRAGALHQKWLAEGRISRTILRPMGDDLYEFNIGDLPEDCRFELLGVVRNRVFGEALKEASKQLRQTRERLGPPNAKGLLLLCIDADAGLSLRVVQHTVGELMMRHGSRNQGIASMVVFSANYCIGMPGSAPVRPWMFLTGVDRDAINTEFVRRLGQAWQARMETHGGPPVLRMGDGNFAFLDALSDQNLRPIERH